MIRDDLGELRPMIRRPVLRAGILPVPYEDEIHLRLLGRLLIASGKNVRDVLMRLLGVLDGSRTVAELEAEVSGPVQESLRVLEQAGLLRDAEPVADLARWTERHPAVFRFFDALMSDPYSALRALEKAKVMLFSAGNLIEPFVEKLTSFGVSQLNIASCDSAQGARAGNMEARLLTYNSGDGERFERELAPLIEGQDMVLVALDAWSPPLLRSVNRISQQTGTPLLPMAQVHEGEFLIGPMVVPGETACWQCMELRMKSNWHMMDTYEAAFERYVEEHSWAARYSTGTPAAFYAAASSLAVIEAVKWIISGEVYMRTLNQVLVFRPFVPETEVSPVLKLPRCPACGNTKPPVRVWMQ